VGRGRQRLNSVNIDGIHAVSPFQMHSFHLGGIADDARSYRLTANEHSCGISSESREAQLVTTEYFDLKSDQVRLYRVPSDGYERFAVCVSGFRMLVEYFHGKITGPKCHIAQPARHFERRIYVI
jgi:hypothetical protein